MVSSKFLAAALGFSCAAVAKPVKRQASSDATILQFALTLEHLENVFYKQALSNFTQNDFSKAGYPADYYSNLQYIAHDEEQHVILLTSALKAAGVTPVQACTYNFPYTDVRSFISLSSVLEGVGTSAYLGAAPSVQSKAYLTVAGSILVTEALHTSLQRLAVKKVPIANPYGTPLNADAVYTLAAAFIVSCPSTNAPLPFTPFPSLSTDGNTCTCEEPSCACADPSSGSAGYALTCSPPVAGNDVTFTAASDIRNGSYVTFVSGLDVISVPGSISGTNITAAIPAQTMGQTYVFVTSKAENGTLVEADVTFGPAILEVKPPAPVYDDSLA